MELCTQMLIGAVAYRIVTTWGWGLTGGVRKEAFGRVEIIFRVEIILPTFSRQVILPTNSHLLYRCNLCAMKRIFRT